MSRASVRPLAVLALVAAGSLLSVPAPGAQAATVDVTVDGARELQTMSGLGANINPGSWDDGNLKPALDLLIDEQGMKTFRVAMDMMDWESRNDDADPQTFNWDYYDPIYSGAVGFDTDLVGSSFADTWAVIDYLHQKGIPDSGIALSFMGPGPDWMGGKYLDPGLDDEFVESVLSAAWWGYSHGHTFGLFSPNNEMDIELNEGVTIGASRYADILDRLATRMDDLGMDGVGLLGPETCCFVDYAEPMKDHPALMDRLAHFDFHNYGGDDNGAAAAASGAGKDFWISEYAEWDHTFAYLEQGAAGLLVWEAYDSVYNHAVLNGHGREPGNDSLSFGNIPFLAYDEATRAYTPRDEFYYFGQLFTWVPIGAQRIAADSTNGDVRIEAFHDAATGRLTLVGQNDSTTEQTLSIALSGVGADSLQYVETNATSHMARGADVEVSGGAATVTVPAETTFTLTGVDGSVALPPSPTPTPTPTATPTATPTPTPTATSVPTPTPTPTPTPSPTPAPTPADPILGSDSVQSFADNDAAGEAEAFRFTATDDGRADTVTLYVDTGSRAATLDIGVYTDDAGSPGTLLASGQLTDLRQEEWNTVDLPRGATLTRGTAYWIGVLGTGGALHFRAGLTGECSQSHAGTGLAELPATWRPGTWWPTCDMSAYVSAVGVVATDPRLAWAGFRR